MHRLAGRQILIGWLMLSVLIAAGALLEQLPSAISQPDGWRALAGPCVVTLAAMASAALLRAIPHSVIGWRLAAVVAGSQLLAISAGPVAYRLVVGPFVSLALAPAVRVSSGTGAHLLCILGADNHVPRGAAINLLALSVCIVLAASWRIVER